MKNQKDNCATLVFPAVNRAAIEYLAAARHRGERVVCAASVALIVRRHRRFGNSPFTHPPRRGAKALRAAASQLVQGLRFARGAVSSPISVANSTLADTWKSKRP